ncbi:potassium/sodium hyperpolarization-activated cyclic nucleotide-gated channel [Aureococcus anophagefferens]|uniref:Potassium/sodium hyperpolarization-activated cyclic nucleotide-gated channel n=3 Tax=Aureococcus anophagefferens TaxID=44056 RepID=A0ABR1FXT9_AURAN
MAPDGDDEAKVPLAVELAPAQADGDRSPARGGSSSPGRGSPSRYVGGLSAVSEEEPRDEDAEIATFLKKQASRLHGMQSPRHSKERGSPILSPDEIEMHLHGAVSELLRVEPASGAASPASSLGGSRSASSSAAARRRTVADAINQLKCESGEFDGPAPAEKTARFAPERLRSGSGGTVPPILARSRSNDVAYDHHGKAKEEDGDDERPAPTSGWLTPRGLLRDRSLRHGLARKLWGTAVNANHEAAEQLPWTHPNSNFRMKWIFLVLIATLYCAIELPVELAFFPGFNVWTFKFLFDLIIDGFFIADIYVAFKTGFIEDGVVVMDAARIRARYLRSGFAADLVATLPLDVVQAFAAAATNDNSSGDNQSLVYSATRIGRIARLSRLLRLARVARFFRYSHFYLSGLHEGHVRILALGFSILLFAHWDACLLYLSARLKDFDADRTWVGFLGLQHRPKSVQYLYAVFKAYSHMLCIGYGVAMPLSTVEVVLTTLSMLLGAALFAGIIGSLTAFMMSLDSPSAKYEVLFAETNDYMDKNYIPAELRTRIRRHLDAKHARGLRRGQARLGTGGQSHSVLDEDQILGQLSPQLRREVNLYLVSRLVESSPLLNGTLVRGAIAIAVVPLLRPLKVLEAETIINRDEPPAGFYFIDAGAVQLYRDEAHVASMEAGSYFGEIPLIFDGVALQPFTAAALEPCELWTISTADFGRLAALFPELKKIMVLIARQRLLRMGVLLKDIEAEAEGSEAALRREDHAVRLLEGLFSSPDVRDIAVRMLVANSARARASTSPAPPAAGLLDQGGVLPAQAETSP